MCWELARQNNIIEHTAVGHCPSIVSTHTREYHLLHRHIVRHTCYSIRSPTTDNKRCPDYTDTPRRCDRNSSAFFSASCGTSASRSSMCLIAEAASSKLASASLRMVRPDCHYLQAAHSMLQLCQLHAPELNTRSNCASYSTSPLDLGHYHFVPAPSASRSEGF